MLKQIIYEIKVNLSEGKLENAIDILKKNISSKNIQEVDFNEIITDFNRHETQDTLGKLNIERQIYEYSQIAERIILKLSNYINQPTINYQNYDYEEIEKLKNLVVELKIRELIHILLYSTNKQLPLVLKDRIIKISFQHFLLENFLIRGIVSGEDIRLFLNRTNSDLFKIIDSLNNLEQFKYYNENPLVFVMIAFDKEMESVYEIIKEVGESFNLNAKRVSDVEGQFIINNKIIEYIQNAKFIVADLSLEKPNVYFELGYARGLNKNVITICNEKSELHFDASPWKCLYYSTKENLRINLYEEFKTQIENGE